MTAYAMVHKHAISFRIMPNTWLTKLPGEL